MKKIIEYLDTKLQKRLAYDLEWLKNSANSNVTLTKEYECAKIFMDLIDESLGSLQIGEFLNTLSDDDLNFIVGQCLDIAEIRKDEPTMSIYAVSINGDIKSDFVDNMVSASKLMVDEVNKIGVMNSGGSFSFYEKIIYVSDKEKYIK